MYCHFWLALYRYVALSDNEKTGFRARELKSVHVDAIGCFVKFIIHKNHINKHNQYNQVGSTIIYGIIFLPLLCWSEKESFAWTIMATRAYRKTCLMYLEASGNREWLISFSQNIIHFIPSKEPSHKLKVALMRSYPFGKSGHSQLINCCTSSRPS
jgi:hypothetical protein